MKKVKSFLKRTGELVETYQFDKFFKVDDICEIINAVQDLDVTIIDGFFSNSLEQPEHLFRVYDSVEALFCFDKDDWYVEDFGLGCRYNGIRFDLTFNFDCEEVITFTDGNIDLTFVLEKLDNLAKSRQ